MTEKRRNKFSAVLIVIIVAVVAIIAITVPTYNNLATSREEVNKSYAQVENVVQRRADLIPNLVNTVKGYTDHESETLEAVTNARAGISEADSPEELAEANEAVSRAIGDINVVVERYPELKADTQFVALMDEISGSENRISVERKNYNEAVQAYNSKLVRFPTNLIGNITGFDEAEYFKADESAKEAPVVDFNN